MIFCGLCFIGNVCLINRNTIRQTLPTESKCSHTLDNDKYSHVVVEAIVVSSSSGILELPKKALFISGLHVLITVSNWCQKLLTAVTRFV